MKNLQKDFNKIVDQTYSIIRCKKFETDEFLANLFSLPIEHRDIHKEFFKSLYSEIENYDSMLSIWHRLNTYWDFLNYTLVENLVEKFGDSDLISRMQDYKKNLKEFRRKTRLCDFAKYHTEYTEQVTEGDLKELVVKLKQRWEECTLEDLEKLKKNITHKFFLPSFLMTIRTFGNNSIIVTWVIPSMIATSLQRNLENIDIREFCKENGIESIHLDGKEILYSPSKKYGAYLKDLYSTKEGKNLAPFKLARIWREKVRRREADEFTKNTFRGDQDDVIYYKKYHMTEDQLCHSTYRKKPQLVLIEGAPGVGKTTFSEQYCYKWSQGKCLKDHTLLVLLPLRDNSVRSAKTVTDLFQHPQLTQDIVQEVEKSQGEGVALWLEAWDELEKSMREESSLFLDLVHGRVLPKATVIITGRPWATKKIRDSSDITVNQHIEIVSTPKIQFSRVLREERLSTENRSKFIDYVNSNPSVKAAMHTTITANIVAEVFQFSRDTESLPPTTMTKLYTAYTCKLLMEHLSRKMADGKKYHKILSLEDVPPDVERELEAICQLAWEGIVEQKLTFTSDTVSVDTLGLMHTVKELYSGEDGQLSYHFIHLTLQEFLSAYHISQLPLDRQQQVIQDHVKVGHLKTVVRFYFGLCKHNYFTSSMISNSISQYKSSSCYHWLFEMEDSKQISNVLGSDKSVSVRSSYEWSPLDYYCLGYCISHSQCQWELNLFSASMGDEGVEMFCNGTLSNRQATCNGKITEANFSNNVITEEGIKSLVKVSPPILQTIEVLHLQSNKLNAEALHVFSTVIPKLTSLQVLNLALNPIGDGGAVELIGTLCHCNTPLKYLNLYGTGIGEEDCASLTILISSTDLETLDVSKNNLSSNSVTSIMNGILQNNTIRTLWMSSSQFSVDNCTSLSSILQQPMCQLKKLSIAWCNIDSVGALQLAAGLTHNQSLEVINISDNPIGDTGAAALCDAISNNTILRYLSMSRCKITSKGFIEVSSSLTNLQELYMGGNSLGMDGAKAVSKMITDNNTLKSLDLSHDDSFGEGVDIIISSLQSNNSLIRLSLPSIFKRPADPRVVWR